MTTATKGPETLNAVAHGYLPAARPRYRWVECDLTELDGDAPEGAEPFQVEIRTNLTFGEIEEIRIFGADSLTYTELWQRIAPYVRAWNLLQRDVLSGEIVPVPPPLDAGPEVFKTLDSALTLWLAMKLRTAHLGGDERGKGATKPAPSDAPPSGDDSA